MAAALAIAAIGTGCTMKSQEAPPLTGPSEQGTSITVTVTPDILVQDGSSQSLVMITAYDGAGKPLRNISLRSEILVNGVATDFGSLSARNLVTDANGRATLVYTAPAAPGGPAVDTNTTVNIAVTPLGTDYGNSLPRVATIRLVPSGVVVPPDGLSPYFTISNSSPTDHQVVLFDACNDPQKACATASNPIAAYNWDFGDGRTGSGKSASHAYDNPGTFVVQLTVTDFVGRTATTSQTINVSQGTLPTAGFTYSPNPAQLNQPIHLNASASRAAAGHRIVSYNWDFGDGTQLTTGSALVDKTFQLPRSYVVTLTVTDETGKTSLPVNQTITPL